MRGGEELEFSAVDGGGRRSRQNVTFLVVPVDQEALSSGSEWRDMSAEPSAVFDFSLEEDSATLARYVQLDFRCQVRTVGFQESKFISIIS